MDQERLRWITRQPTLDTWECRVTFSAGPTGVIATLWAAGRCNRKRGHLWTYEEAYEVGKDSYSLHDAITHLSLVCEQDRPTSRTSLDRSLVGEHWEQPELPW